MDRIDDAYNGLMGEDFMRKTRERMHWICSKIEGANVLDVGCSQGTLARLLASVGKSVFGVDINPEAIAYANAKLEEADDATKDRLRFHCGNFMDFKTDERFDTIVMGEILEHLPDPEAFIRNAYAYLRQSGVYVVTVPFGINDDPDHRQTFYWSWIMEKFAPYFKVKEVKIFGRWIGVVGLKRDSKGDVEEMASLSIVKDLERAFYALERPLVNDCKAKGLKLQAQKEILDETKKNLADSRSEVSSIKARAEKVFADYAKLKTNMEDALGKQQTMFATEQAKSKDLNAKLCATRDEFAAKLKECNAKLSAIRNELTSKKDEVFKLRVGLEAEKKIEKERKDQIAECLRDMKELRLSLAAKDREAVERAERLGRMTEQIETLKRECDAVRVCLSEERTKCAELAESTKSKDSELTKVKVNNKNLSDKNKRIDALYTAEKKKYDKLSKAKLGRLTLAYWRVKDSIKAKLKGENNPSKTVQTKERPVPSALKSAPVCEKAKTVLASIDNPPKGDESFFARMAPKIAGMPVSNGSRYYDKIPVKIGVICDRFYWDAINSAADFVYVSPNVTEDVLAKLDCMLVVSTWRGLENDEWRGFAKEGHPMRVKANEIIEYCRRNKIPTIFYSKEDPPNYAVYVGMAQKCDFVFTSAEECIPDYRRDCGHDRVYPMMFCINPIMHNPIGMCHAKEKERNVIFSGSWMEKYPQRCHDLEMIFNGILNSGRSLNIIDRNYERRGNPRYCYPEKFRKFQAPAIDHGDLQKVHRLYDWAVNINSVQNSRTMFANRIYELQACGNLLISNYSLGVKEMFHGVFIVNTEEDAVKALSLSSDEVIAHQSAGVRRVMTGETCFDRIAYMLNTIGMSVQAVRRRILVVTKTIDAHVKEMFDAQTYADKILCCEMEVSDKIYDSCDMVAFLDERVDYEKFYLEDLSNAFKYTSCDWIGRADEAAGEQPFGYTSKVRSKFSAVFWRKAFDRELLMAQSESFDCANGFLVRI